MALLGALGFAASMALAASGPPAPSITAHPANPTASTSASFAFSDSQSKVTFICSLDGSAYAACTSPKSYSGLAQGSHTFSVEAKDQAGNTSGATSYTWTIDLTPPTITISFPANGGFYNGAGWSAGCKAGAGVCGTTSDPSGVSSVIVSIKQNATGKYWNGSSYSAATETYKNATLSNTGSWSYALPLPSPDGQYTLHVRATDSLGNQTPSTSPAASQFTIVTVAPPAPQITSHPALITNQTTATFSFTDSQAGVSFLCSLDGSAYTACTSPKSYTGLLQGIHVFAVEAKDAAGNISAASGFAWLIITTAPPTPTITGHPANPTTSTTATFTFTDTQSGVTYQCQLDGSSWQACTSGVTYNNLAVGNHSFGVRAVDQLGNTSSAATYSWTIQQATGMPFTISGNAVGKLYPGGAAQALAVKLTNPNNVPIYVTGLTATLQTSGLPTGCQASWFSIVQSNASSSQSALVPANGSVTLPAQAYNSSGNPITGVQVSAPTIQMPNVPNPQNACAGATLNISYAGSAHS